MKRNKLAQKKRNRPIAISDIAIAKVPRTNIFGFSNDQNLFIQEMHKELLRRAKELCQKSNSNSMEVVIILDTHTWDNWVIEGKQDNVVEINDNPEAKMILETATKNSLMLLHNHPSTGSFSARDLITFCNNDSIFIMTAVGNDGSVYLLKKELRFDPSQLLLSYGELAEKYKAMG